MLTRDSTAREIDAYINQCLRLNDHKECQKALDHKNFDPEVSKQTIGDIFFKQYADQTFSVDVVGVLSRKSVKPKTLAYLLQQAAQAQLMATCERIMKHKNFDYHKSKGALDVLRLIQYGRDISKSKPKSMFRKSSTGGHDEKRYLQPYKEAIDAGGPEGEKYIIRSMKSLSGAADLGILILYAVQKKRIEIAETLAMHKDVSFSSDANTRKAMSLAQNPEWLKFRKNVQDHEKSSGRNNRFGDGPGMT